MENERNNGDSNTNVISFYVWISFFSPFSTLASHILSYGSSVFIGAGWPIYVRLLGDSSKSVESFNCNNDSLDRHQLYLEEKSSRFFFNSDAIHVTHFIKENC